MFFLRHRLESAAVDLFQPTPVSSAADITALQTQDTATIATDAQQTSDITALQTGKADVTALHNHTNQAILDAIAGHGSLALAGRNLTFTKTDGAAEAAIDLGSDSAVWNAGTSTLTITHIDGSQTIVNIPVATVLDPGTPPAYNDVAKTVTFTWSDASTSVMNVAGLFDDTAFASVSKTDASKTLTYTRLNASTVNLDISAWFPVLLSGAESINPAGTAEGLVSGTLLGNVINNYVPVNANTPDIAGLTAVVTTGFKGRERRYVEATKQLALWTTVAGGDVTPTAGSGSWWLVGTDAASLTTMQAAITALQTGKADVAALHSHANIANLDNVTGVGDLNIAGTTLTLTRVDATTKNVALPSDSAVWNAVTSTLTINHVDGSQTVAAIPTATVLSTTTPPSYDGATKKITFTWSDASTSEIDVTNLFDDTAFGTVTKNDGAKSLEFTRLNTGTVGLDLSAWFPGLLTKAQVESATDATEGLASGVRLHEHYQFKQKLVTATDNMNLEWGVRYVLNSAHTYTFPTPSGDPNDVLEAFPADGWQTFDPVNRWSAPGVTTIGAGQVDQVSSNYGLITFHGESAANIRVFG